MGIFNRYPFLCKPSNKIGEKLLNIFKPLIIKYSSRLILILWYVKFTVTSLYPYQTYYFYFNTASGINKSLFSASRANSCLAGIASTLHSILVKPRVFRMFRRSQSNRIAAIGIWMTPECSKWCCLNRQSPILLKSDSMSPWN